jgi:hypothetical protein
MTNASDANACLTPRGVTVTLMDLGNAIVEEIKMESGVIPELVGEFDNMASRCRGASPTHIG